RAMHPGEPLFEAASAAIGVEMLLNPFRIAEPLDRLENLRVSARLTHFARRKIRVTSRAVPVATGRLRVEAHLNPVIFGDADEQVACEPEMVAHLGGPGGTDLKFPLPRHHLGVDSRDLEPGRKTRIEVPLGDLASLHVFGADAAIVGPLRRWIAV